jgi:hypothetical protein
MTGGTLSTKYGGSLGRLVRVLLIALSLGCPLRATAQATGALDSATVVAIDPPERSVDAQETFSVKVTIADSPDLEGYEFTLIFDPAVVEVQAVEQGPFLEDLSPIALTDIKNEAGTATLGAFGQPGVGSDSWPTGSGELVTIRLKAVGDGSTILDLRDVQLFGPDGGDFVPETRDGLVQVGEEIPSTDTPTEGPATSETPAPTSAATATEGATPPPEATATKTPTGGGTDAPEATATESPAETATPPSGATATESPVEAVTAPPEPTATELALAGGTATAEATSTARPGQTPVEEGSPTATTQPVEGEGATVEPAMTSADEPSGGETPAGVSPWPILAAVLLGLAGVALIGVGIFAFGLERWPEGEPMDDARG